MKNKFIVLFTITSIIFLFTSCAENNKLTTKTDFIMDTFVEQKFYGKNSDIVVDDISKKLIKYEDKMSMHIENSDISMINKNAGIKYVKVSDDVYNIISKAKEYSKETNGVFDITIAPLTQLWGVTSENPKVPSKQNIENAIKLVNYNDILLDEKEKSIMLKNKGQMIDLGAIAKGAVANIIFDEAKKYNIKYGYVSVGGNMVVVGTNPKGEDYNFGIRDPKETPSQYIGSLTLTGKTMATTGGYERFFIEDGEKYIHVLDTKTGYPVVSDLLSVSVISKDGALADYLSTALFCLGKEEVLKHKDDDSFDYVAIDNQNNIYVSYGIKNNFKINKDNKTYKLLD